MKIIYIAGSLTAIYFAFIFFKRKAIAPIESNYAQSVEPIPPMLTNPHVPKTTSDVADTILQTDNYSVEKSIADKIAENNTLQAAQGFAAQVQSSLAQAFKGKGIKTKVTTVIKEQGKEDKRVTAFAKIEKTHQQIRQNLKA